MTSTTLIAFARPADLRDTFASLRNVAASLKLNTASRPFRLRTRDLSDRLVKIERSHEKGRRTHIFFKTGHTFSSTHIEIWKSSSGRSDSYFILHLLYDVILIPFRGSALDACE